MTAHYKIITIVIAFCITSTTYAQETERPVYAMDANGENVRSVVSLKDYPHAGSPDISPDGKRIAIDAWQKAGDYRKSSIFIVDIETSEVQDLGPPTESIWRIVAIVPEEFTFVLLMESQPS